MRWKLDINQNYKQTIVKIEAPKMTEEISNLTTFIDQLTCSLLVKKDDAEIKLNLLEIMYIENIERKTFVYTETDIYEINRPLYDLEKKLKAFDFIRINKQTLINPRYIKSVKALFNSRFELSMISEEKLIVTRHYQKEFKALFTKGGLYDA